MAIGAGTWFYARQRSGMTLTDIGKTAEGLDYRCVSFAVRRFAKRMQTDRKLRRLLSRASSRF